MARPKQPWNEARKQKLRDLWPTTLPIKIVAEELGTIERRCYEMAEALELGARPNSKASRTGKPTHGSMLPPDAEGIPDAGGRAFENMVRNGTMLLVERIAAFTARRQVEA